VSLELKDAEVENDVPGQRPNAHSLVEMKDGLASPIDPGLLIATLSADRNLYCAVEKWNQKTGITLVRPQAVWLLEPVWRLEPNES
jgi:hypothetical protein